MIFRIAGVAVNGDTVAYGTAYASYAYDANGNRLSRTSGAGTGVGTYDAQDRLTSYDGATYTPAGEPAEKVEGTDTTRYGYDELGNLTDVERHAHRVRDRRQEPKGGSEGERRAHAGVPVRRPAQPGRRARQPRQRGQPVRLRLTA